MRGKDAIKAYAEIQNNRVFGEGGVDGHDDIRKLESENGKKVKYSISGPRISLFGVDNIGLLNAGEYSIEKTREYIAKLGEEQIRKIYDDPAFKASNEDIFMPQPLTDTQEKPEKIRQINTLLGSGKHSIYDVFAKSTLVNMLVENMVNKGEDLELFASGDMQKINKRLDMITYSIGKEASRNARKESVIEDLSKNLKTGRNKNISTVRSPNHIKM